MQREVAMIGPDACIMRDQDVGCLPVIDNGQLIGMVSDRDIVVRGMAGALNPYRAIVRDVMSATAGRVPGRGVGAGRPGSRGGLGRCGSCGRGGQHET
jgi:CBS domain-containing protein